MGPRDYKHSTPRPAARGGAARYGSWASFASGLGIGLVVALGVYLWSASLPRPTAVVAEMAEDIAPAAGPAAATIAAPPVAPAVTSATPAAAPADAAAATYDPPVPKFDFYKILPEMEVPVKEWEMEQQAASAAPAQALDEGAYVLQVGSFKNFEDADRAKASLALRGITASVQRVVINGQDVWFRVHVGPVSDVATLRALRVKLSELDVDFILLRLGGPAAR